MLDLGLKIHPSASGVFYEHLIDPVDEDLKSDSAQSDGSVEIRHNDTLTPMKRWIRLSTALDRC